MLRWLAVAAEQGRNDSRSARWLTTAGAAERLEILAKCLFLEPWRGVAVGSKVARKG